MYFGKRISLSHCVDIFTMNQFSTSRPEKSFQKISLADYYSIFKCNVIFFIN